MKLSAIIPAALLLTLGFAVSAHEFRKGDIVIHHPWTRATPEGATVGVGYLKITNGGSAPDRLTGGTFDGAENVEIHEMKMNGDAMTMRQLKDGLEIKGGETIEFKPMSYHLMLTGLKKPIANGANVTGTLTFEKAGTVEVNYKVEPFGATTSSDDHHDKHE